MRGLLPRWCVAAVLTLGLVACGIKGNPHAPRPVPPSNTDAGLPQ
ncbi:MULTISPECIES: lipoprotein [unclassified Corallococcus]|nr:MULTISPECIES: lipoprotein [unclassified Corallococcus]